MRLGLAMAIAFWASTALASDLKVINDKAAFPEGPFFRDGRLFYVEYGSGWISTWDGTTNKKLWQLPGCGPSAVAPLGKDFVVACFDSGTVVRMSEDGHNVATYSKSADGHPFTGANDFASDGNGGLYFTSTGPWETGPIVGRVFHLDTDGNIVQLADDVDAANGIVLSPDGKRLYVAETGAGRIISFAVSKDGTLDDRRTFFRLLKVDPGSGPDASPDGVKLGPDGNLYIGENSKGRILVVSLQGALVKAIDIPSNISPNMAFSDDGSKMFVMAVDDMATAPFWGKIYEVPLK